MFLLQHGIACGPQRSGKYLHLRVPGHASAGARDDVHRLVADEGVRQEHMLTRKVAYVLNDRLKRHAGEIDVHASPLRSAGLPGGRGLTEE